MFAVPFGDDGFAGDSGFWLGDKVEASLESTLEECLAAHRAIAESGQGEDFDEEEYEAPVGFWLLSEKDAATADVVYDADFGGSDGESYGMNRAAKRVCAHLAARTLGTFPSGPPADIA